LSHDEQYTQITLWAMARSPLFFWGDMCRVDNFTLSLLTNEEVLAIDAAHRTTSSWQKAKHRGRGVPSEQMAPPCMWRSSTLVTRWLTYPFISAQLTELGMSASAVCAEKDVWAQQPLPPCTGEIALPVNTHGVQLVGLQRSEEANSVSVLLNIRVHLNFSDRDFLFAESCKLSAGYFAVSRAVFTKCS
jgi:alpha-galactosidase